MKVGDVVRSTLGIPRSPMTIERICSNGHVTCMWFDANAQLQRFTFYADHLYKPEEKA